MAENIDIALVKKRSITGIVTLTFRSIMLYAVAIIGTFFLTIFLTVSDFGIFYLVTAIISFLNYFSDIGLAAALIQKKEEITQDDLTTTFSIQQVLVILLVIALFLLSSYIGKFYQFTDEGILLFRSLLIAFFLSSLKTIPSVQLERKLQFNRLIIPQIMETLVFYFMAVILAWKGFGILSLSWAVLIRSIVGLITIYVISPWRITVGVSMHAARSLLRFGVPFQLNSFLALLKDDLLIIVLGYILPVRDIGYIGWAKKWSDMPLRMFMDNIIKVTFPAYSRIQHSQELMAKAIQKTLFGMSVCIFPIYVVLVFLINPLVKIIPKYTQWEPAIYSFYFFAGTSIFASISTPLTNVFNAVGKIKTTLFLMILWVTLTWIFTLLLVYLIGYHGVAVGALIVSFSVVLVVYLAKYIAPFQLWSAISSGTVGSLLLFIFFDIFKLNKTYSLFNIFIITSFGLLLYVCYIWILEKRRIVDIIHSIKK